MPAPVGRHFLMASDGNARRLRSMETKRLAAGGGSAVILKNRLYGVARMKPNMAVGLAVLIALGLGGAAVAQQGHGMRHGMMGQQMQQHQHGMMGGMMGRGMQAMLHGPGSTESETLELAAMFHNHADISRTVINLPDGIDTVTESHDPELRAILVSHVVGMIARVEQGRDPQVPVQSPTLDILFENRTLIETVMEPTEHGIRVIQRSNDAATVAALQTHAAEVSVLAARGMMAIHEGRMAHQ